MESQLIPNVNEQNDTSSTSRCQWNYSSTSSNIVSRSIKEDLVDIFEIDDYCDADPEYDIGIIGIFEFLIYYSTINFFFKLKIFLFKSAEFDSQISLGTVTRLITHKLTAILPTTVYPANADIITNILIDKYNTTLESTFNQILPIELKAFRGVRIRLAIPSDPVTHKYTPPN
ncbi:MAG: hypothetical protein EZS28_025213 [Streblomastix strix]|uniref:Uncharacterized protein n=1 Tax=Streblomastix strix TaxID=222440 RepID=A0A5J4V9M2_9EUKA|nr:MAG: hypothetical protein EZS28_025213 [Streblomastix strix]